MNPRFQEEMVEWRRLLHRTPELGWTEFVTTARIAAKLRQGGFEVFLGRRAISAKHVVGRDETLVAAGLAFARDQGVDEAVLEEMEGLTGCVGVWRTGRPGPTVALRFDIDCVAVSESVCPTHAPARLGFGSERPGLMHACGHDGHTAIGLAVAGWVAEQAATLRGTIKVLFQPAEEGTRGAAAMVGSGVLDDVDCFLAAHLAMMARTGEIVASPTGLLCTTKLDLHFQGKPAHAGVEPHAGRNALVAACHAVTQLMGIPRHGAGMTRINVGRISGGEGRNVIPEAADVQLEVRGATDELDQYMLGQVMQVVEGIARSFEVGVAATVVGKAMSLSNDAELVERIVRIAAGLDGVAEVMRQADFGGSEDATLMVRHVQQQGGQAAYFVIGSNRPAGHHQAEFDFDEASLSIGFELFVALLRDLASVNGAQQPV